MSVLGPGAVCCGDPVDCQIVCEHKSLLYALDDVAVELDVDLTDEEDEDE